MALSPPHTFSAQVERLTGASVERAYVDRGYRGHGLTTPQVYLSNTRGIASPTIKRELISDGEVLSNRSSAT